MPNTHSNITDLFDDIADAIREKDETVDPIVADTFPARIRAIPSGGGVPSGTNVGDILVWDGDEWVAEQPGRLPYGYQEVEYIQSSGTQYIDTGLKINECVQVTAVLSFDDLTINQNNGVDEGDTTNYSMINYRNDNKAQTVYYKDGVGAEFFKFGSITSTSQKYKIQVSQVSKYAFFDGTPYQLEYLIRAVGNTHNFFIAAGNSQGTPLNFAHEKIYGFDFFDDFGEPTGRFVPCYRKSDNEIGMYDLVTDTFFTNAGTGTFVKGADV